MRRAMIALLTLSASAALGAAAAQAKPTPIEPVRLTHSTDETAMTTGPAGAMLEADYFQAPRRPLTAERVFPLPFADLRQGEARANLPLSRNLRERQPLSLYKA